MLMPMSLYLLYKLFLLLLLLTLTVPLLDALQLITLSASTLIYLKQKKSLSIIYYKYGTLKLVT